MSENDPFQYPADEPGEPVEDFSGLPEEPPMEPPVSEGPVAADDDGMSWYIIHTYSGFENKVAESLRTRSEAFAFSRLRRAIRHRDELVNALHEGGILSLKRDHQPADDRVERLLPFEPKLFIDD